jgi:hypothetical protein
MAADATGTKSVTNTLSTTVADSIRLQQCWPAVEIHNQGSNILYVRFDGTAPVSEANECESVPAGAVKSFDVMVGPSTAAGAHVVGIVGSGDKYTVTGVAG